MNINIDVIRRIISSDELCDKANSTEYRNTYKNQIENYILSLCNDINSINTNIEYINRYLKKFVLTNTNKEEIFFNKVLTKLYKYKINNEEYKEILNTFKFEEIKELLMQKYNQYINSNTSTNEEELKKMLTFYCTTCENYIMPYNYINYFTYNIISKNIKLEQELIKYYYKIFALYFASTKNLNTEFKIKEQLIDNDPYYDNRIKDITIYGQNISDKIDYKILADIFYQIKYLYLIKCINTPNNNNYTYEQLELVKELCVTTILTEQYFNKNYQDISFTKKLKEQSEKILEQYLKSIGLNIDVKIEHPNLTITEKIENDKDKPISIDVLFDLTLKKENPMLLKELIKNHPILACEYKNDRKKTLLNMLLNIYSNRTLLKNLNKDLEWYNKKIGNDADEIVMPKIERLQNKILVCTSCINVMNESINNSDMTTEDLVRSISALITYNTEDKTIKNDIYILLNNIIPKKIKKLCKERNKEYKEITKEKIIKCYLDSMGLIRNNMETEYFMKIYQTLEICIKAFD